MGLLKDMASELECPGQNVPAFWCEHGGSLDRVEPAQGVELGS